MGLLTNLFRLVPPSFRAGWCPKSIQELINEAFNGAQVTFLLQQGNFIYNYGSVTPAPENRIFPWLYTPTGQWFTFQFGLWVTPMDPSQREPDFRKMWKPATGTAESALWSLDGGDGTDPRPTLPGPPIITNPSYSPINSNGTTGASWMVDHDFDGLFPLGAGTIPNSAINGATADVVVALGDIGGNYAHLLSAAEGAIDQHTHLLGISQPNADSAAFAKAPSITTVPGYNALYIDGGNTQHLLGETTADMTTLPVNAGANPAPDPTSFVQMPQYRVIYWVQPTGRRWFTLPA